jgi:hypothetical protein
MLSLARRSCVLVAAAALAASAGQVLACCPPHEEMGTIDPKPSDRQPVVRIALLLDTSNSMDGLISQAKSQLWAIVNRFDKCSREGKKPRLEIALYQYGNSSLSEGSQWVQMVSGFTSDLDLLSEKLFGLTTNGGEEFCGAVIDRAVQDLSWDRCPGDLSMIFIAGNEPFDQGGVRYPASIAKALEKGIRVNTIFCGGRQEGVQTHWEDGATRGRGGYSYIDQGADPTPINSPYDDEIGKLSMELNTTYVGYGAMGGRGAARQEAMDSAAQGVAPAAAAERAASKASGNYSNSGWDLIDAVKEKKVALKDVKDADLPKELQGKTVAEREVEVEKLSKRRGEVQQQIQALNAKREKFLTEQRAQQQNAPTTLGDALVTLVTQQAIGEGYEFAK